VDIQPVAVEIAKLRFFLSLIVDEDTEDDKENRGVIPLPNLEFKFVAANTLIGFTKMTAGSKYHMSGYETIIDRLKKLRNEHFSSYGQKKKNIEREFISVQNEIAKNIHLWSGNINQALQLSNWNPFSHESIHWFDPGWMFGDTDGFDIVLGNPPYVRADNPEIAILREKILSSKSYKSLWEKWDLYVAFMEKGFSNLKRNGVLEFIISDAYMTAKYAEKSQEYFLNHSSIKRIDFCSELKIFDAAIKNIIIEFENIKDEDNIPLRLKHINFFGNYIKLKTGKQKVLRNKLFNVNSMYQKDLLLKNCISWEEICYVSIGMVLNAHEDFAKGEFKKEDLIADQKDEIHSREYIEAKWIQKYQIEKKKYLEWKTERVPSKIRRPTFPELYYPDKIMMGGMTGAIYDEDGLLCNHSITISVLWKDLKDVWNRSIEMSIKKDFDLSNKKYLKRKELEQNSQRFSLKYLLAILNSKLGMYLLSKVRRSQLGFYPDDLKKLSIKIIPIEEQKQIVEIVDQILSLKKSNPNADTSKLEEDIDWLVYELYDLTEDEIEIIEST